MIAIGVKGHDRVLTDNMGPANNASLLEPQNLAASPYITKNNEIDANENMACFVLAPVNDQRYQKRAIWLGCFASFFYPVNWGLVMLFGVAYGIFGQNSNASHRILEALVHLLVASLIGWGIYKRSKAATLTGLILALIGGIGNCFAKGILGKNTILSFLVAFMFVQSTRGIFAYHKA